MKEKMQRAQERKSEEIFADWKDQRKVLNGVLLRDAEGCSAAHRASRQEGIACNVESK